MSLDARLSTIVEEASETFRTALRDILSGAVLNLPLPSSALQEIARRGYELGYREALASRAMAGVAVAGVLVTSANTGSIGVSATPAEAGSGDAFAGVAAPHAEAGALAGDAALAPAIVDGSNGAIHPAVSGELSAAITIATDAARDWVDDSDVEMDGEGESSAPALPSSEPTSDVEPIVDWSNLDEEPESPNLADVDVVEAAIDRPRQASAGIQRIFPHASVGTLRQRIVDVFDLTRFDIDVIVCRKGDRARRQLKATVKLSKYLLRE
ncbi:MAG: hypothetical protein KF894_30910 [Labilithrix sp.]|nr:hypothetical protein [Labilithrix sp.]